MPQHRRPTQPRQRLEGRIHVQQHIIHGLAGGVANQFVQRHPFAHRGVQGVVSFLTRAQHFLRLLALGEVAQHDAQLRRSAGFRDGGGRQLKPAGRSAGRPQPQLAGLRPTGRQKLLAETAENIAVLRVEEKGKRLVDQCAAVHAEPVGEDQVGFADQPRFADRAIAGRGPVI